MTKHICKILWPFAFLLLYLSVDYVNLPSLLGIIPQHINLNLFGIFFDATLVVAMFIISFYYIENRQNEKDANAQAVSITILNKTYEECLNYLSFLDSKEMVGEYIYPKVDGNIPVAENKVIRNLQTLPFSSSDAIMALATSGHIPQVAITEFLEIKKEYQYLISMKIIFFDLNYPKTEEQISMYNDIKQRDEKLKSKLKLLAMN